MSITKKQHYVPQFYLKYFAKNDQIYVFDKFSQNSFAAKVRDIASSNYFYDFSLETISELEELIKKKRVEENIDQDAIESTLQQIREVQILEHHLSQLEGQSASILSAVIEGLEENREFKHEYRLDLAHMVALQFMRTNDFRESLLENAKNLESAIMHLLPKINEVDKTNYTVKDLGVEVNDDAISNVHKFMLLNRDNLESCAQILNNHIWIIEVNETHIPTYISDNPVCRQAHMKDKYLSHMGIMSPGIQIVMPLTPKYILTMYERSVFASIEHGDNFVIPATDKTINNYNYLQVFTSYRQIYSQSQEFGFIVELIDRHPQLKKPLSRWGTPSNLK